METNNGQTRFDLIIVDSDTALYQAAKFVQEDYVIVKNLLTGISKEFKNKSTFQGLKKTGNNEGWLGEINQFLGVDFKQTDFEITQHTRLKPDIINHLEEAEKQFAYFVGSIKSLPYANDYKLCLAGEGNFRNQAAKILPYKGSRPDKPIVFAELKAKIHEQYKSKIILANDCESDDNLGIYAAQNQAYFRKNGKYKYLLAYLDKDMKQLWGPYLKLNAKEDGVQFISPFEAAYNFAFQLLIGDKGTDNIQGLPDLAPETREKYGIKKGKGCGEASAEKILGGSTTIPELFGRVVECYKDFYKEGYHTVGDPNSHVTMYNWKDFLAENGLLLWMQRTKGQRFDIFKDLLDKLEVKY